MQPRFGNNGSDGYTTYFVQDNTYFQPDTMKIPIMNFNTIMKIIHYP